MINIWNANIFYADGVVFKSISVVSTWKRIDFFFQIGYFYPMHLHNRKYMKNIRKHLRNHSTPAEATLWKTLSKSQVGGYKFRRQHSLGKYVVDFFCYELQLAIELDGQPHADLSAIVRDTERDQWLKNNGITVLRYENRWVYEYPEVIKNDILQFAKNRNTHTTSPSLRKAPPGYSSSKEEK